MSNVYIQEPATEGKVLVVTSAGDFDIELWSREAPKACRNFVQLCLEGYYNGCIFHRVVPGFIVQGGDPTGTGEGGESIYGKPFKDEFHTRLRFVRRGLVAMANAGPHDNSSQFFFTLGKTTELQNKHTIFGKITGNTMYNLPRFEESIIGKDDRPEYPHKIVRTEVLNNPFPDIIPRLAIENEVTKEERKKKKKGTKNFKLLSFGDEAEEEEEEVVAETKRLSTKGNSAHDIAKDPTLSSSTWKKEITDEETLERIRKKLNPVEEEVKQEEEVIQNEVEETQETNEVTDSIVPEKKEEEERRAEIKAEIKQLKQELSGKKPKAEAEVKEELENKDTVAVKEYKAMNYVYQERRAQMQKEKDSRESETLARLRRFTDKLKSVINNESGSEEEKEEEEEVDEWLKHKFFFDSGEPVLAKDANTKDENWYDLHDPRNTINKRRREDSAKQAKKHKK